MDGDLLRGNIGLRGFWLTWPNRILTEDRPGDCTSYGDGGGGQTGYNSKKDQIARGEQFWLNLAEFLLKLDSTRNCTDGPGTRFRRLNKVWLSKESMALHRRD